MTIEIHEIAITDWVDASSHDGVKLIPTRMSVGATIGDIWVENIILPYIPITSKDEIIEAIKKTLVLGEAVEDAHPAQA